MSGNAARLALPVILAVALAGCASQARPEVDPNIFPANYKQEILDTITPMLEDPTNVRDAYVTDPALRSTGKDERYTVCVRANSRNERRQYTGVKDRIAYFYGGHLNQLVDASKEQCGNAAYKPFPELEKLCLAKKCG